MLVNKNKLEIISIPESAKGSRLDKYLGTLDLIQSRSRALQLILENKVLVNGVCEKPSLILKGGEVLQIEIPEPPQLELQGLELSLEILYEDEHLIVLNKPPGLVVHPAAGHSHDTLVNALVAYSHQFKMKFGENRPGIVHRLDKDTSGIMVVAKNDLAQERLSQQFRERSIKRHYLAIVSGHLVQNKGSIKSFLARHPVDRKKFSSVKDTQKKIIREPNFPPKIGKWAHTDFQVLSNFGIELSYIKLKLHTGRTHQIRVHLSEMGFPILGDSLYAQHRKMRKVPRMALHATELGFKHPITEIFMNFRKDWPNDFKEMVDSLFPKVCFGDLFND